MLLSLTFAALAAVGSANAQGSAMIFNYCQGPVNLWAVDADRNPQSPTSIAPGSSYSEVYHSLGSGGVSLKLGFGNSLYDGSPITQFEYTLAGGQIWYDISNVNCGQGTSSAGQACPFGSSGMHLEASDPSCPARTCAAGEAPCAGAYNNYNDDWNSLACEPSADIKLYLCVTGDGPAAAAAPPPPAAAVAGPPVAATPTPPPAPVQKMEALTDRKLRARAAGLQMHRHMRRHMHQH